MEEPRRLQFTTIGPSNREKKKPPPCQTIRINLDLTEANDETCPEFSYVELLKNAVGGAKEGSSQDSEGDPDPFGDSKEDDKLAEIARRFEEKYGPKPGKKNRKPDRIQDLVDLGEGYDETDNFIDNSEAYDEIVPACLTTKLGGFYINSGVLDFREVSDDSADEFAPRDGSVKKKRKAQRLTSDSESDGEVLLKKKRGPKPKKKFQEGFPGKKRKRLSAEGEKIFKRPRKPIDKWKRKKRSPTVSELLKQQAASTTTSSVNGVDSTSTTSNSSCSANLHNGTNIDSAIESVISRGLQEDSNSQSDERLSFETPETVPKLPTGLSSRLEDTITKLKKAAKDSREGKCRFFTHEVNRMLLVVELESQQVSCSTRQTVYTHLAAYLPCSKETLLKRAKKLRLNENDDKLKEPIQRLKDAINATMPAQLEKHQQECRIAAQMRMLEGKDGVKEEASTESDDEEKPASDGDKKRYMSPRRKFEWSSEIRSLLCEIVCIKMKTYDLSKLRAQSAEEYLKSFLDAEIKLLWPKGWMQTRMLYKESRSAHDMWTNPQKPKKAMVVTKAADSGVKSYMNPLEGVYPGPSDAVVKPDTGTGVPTSLVSSTDDNLQRELKTGHASGLDQTKGQVSSTNKSLYSDVPTLLDYAGQGPSTGPRGGVDSTVPSSKSGHAASGYTEFKSTNKSNIVDSTSTSIRNKPEECDTHNIAMEILKSMRQIPQAARNLDANKPAKAQPNPTKPSQRETVNSGSFLAQFQKYATSVPSVQTPEEQRGLFMPEHKLPGLPSLNTSKQDYMQPWQKGKSGEVTPPVLHSPHSLPQKQVSPPSKMSPQQEKVHSTERKQSPFTLLHQQLEQQQQKQKQRQQEVGTSKEHISKDTIPGGSTSKSPQISPSSNDGRQSPHSMVLNQQIQHQIQQNYLNLLQKTHGVGQSKPPQPPNSAQTAKRQSLLAAAISGTNSTVTESSSQVSSQAGRVSSNHHRTALLTAGVSTSQDRPPSKAARVSHPSSHQGQSLHSTSLLSLKKKLNPDSHSGHSGVTAQSSAPQKKAKMNKAGHPHTAPGSSLGHTHTSQTVINPVSLTGQSVSWNLLSFVNSTATPPAAHTSVLNSAAMSAFSPPLAHSQVQGSSRSSPNYQNLVMTSSKKTPSPTSSLHHSARSPDSGRAVVSSTVPFSQAQLSPRTALSPHGSPMGGMYAGHGMHSPNSPRTAASPHSMFPPMHGSSLQHPYTFSDLNQYRLPDSSRSPHGY